MFGVRHEVLPFLGVGILVAALILAICRLFGWRRRRARLTAASVALVLCAYFVYFFRDPGRTPPEASDVVVAGADGVVAGIRELSAPMFAAAARKAGLEPAQLGRLAQGRCVRISIFLSLFSVHVNRAPIGGSSRFLGYFPGKHFFTFQEKSSDANQHNSIFIENATTCCLINQIVGPICRRVVYWPDHDAPAEIRMGDRIGMMKFGSRLDMYLPRADVTLEISEGDKVTAGETVIARLQKESTQ